MLSLRSWFSGVLGRRFWQRLAEQLCRASDKAPLGHTGPIRLKPGRAGPHLRPTGALLLLSFFGGGATSAFAADIQTDTASVSETTVIKMTGRIVAGDLYKITQALDNAPTKRPIIVALASLGGHSFESMKMGLEIKRHGAGTVVMPNTICASGCALMFFGGYNGKLAKPNRIAYESGRVAVHRWVWEGDGVHTAEQDARLAKGIEWYLNEMHVSKDIQHRLFETLPPAGYVLTDADMLGSEILLRPAQDSPPIEITDRDARARSLGLIH